MKILHDARAVLFFAVFFLFTPQFAQAYIDPGGIGFAIQALLAAAFGGLLAVKMYWQKLKRFITVLFSGVKERTESASGAASTQATRSGTPESAPDKEISGNS